MSEATKTSDTLTVTIDGRSIEARPGELIIEAAERAGVFIPRFCYHPRMKPVGMCRMCLVEVSSPRGPSLLPACFVSVADGQEIETASDSARKAQEGVLEFLLVNHPLDCPVCDKGGECPLQDQSMSHGPGESRFIEEKRHWAKPTELGPLTLLDRERCIQCARCTRFAEEIAGEPLIDFYSRGDEIEVAVFPEHPFTSYFSGNTVQICPVGALTSVPYRFKSRPWDLEQVESTCTYCAVGCRVALQSSAGRVVRLIGIDSEPVNQSWLCDRGRYGFEAIHSEDRLSHPLVRQDGELRPVSWNEALREVGAGLRQALSSQGPTSIGIIGGSRLANEDQYAWSKLARAVIGTDNIDCQLEDGLPGELVAALPPATIEDAVSASLVIVCAGDLREELPVLHLRLRAAAAHNGLKVIDCSPVPTALFEVAASVLPSPPGREAAVLAALLGEADPPEGLSPDAVASGRNLLREADPSRIVVVLGRPSLSERSEAAAAAAAAVAAAIPGARFLPALRRGNVRGGIDMGLSPGLLPGRVSLEAGREWFGEQWGSLPEGRGLGCREMLEAAAAGTLRALVLLGSDPLIDFPDRDLATRALERVPFLVSIDTLPSASSQLADVVLPAAGYGERGGTTTNLEGRVTRIAQKVVPPGVARPDWVIATEIAERLGLDLGFDHLEGIWEEIEEVAPSHRGATLEAVYGPSGDDGVMIPVRQVDLGRILRPLDPIATPGIESVNLQGSPMFAGAAEIRSGNVAESVEIEEPYAAGELPRESVALLEGPDRPALVVLDPAAFPPPAIDGAPEGGLRLVTRRHLYDGGTMVQASVSLRQLASRQDVRVAPGALEELGLSEGDEVCLVSARGELAATISGDRAVPPGVAIVGYNLVAVDEAGASSLIDSDHMLTDVRIERVES